MNHGVLRVSFCLLFPYDDIWYWHTSHYHGHGYTIINGYSSLMSTRSPLLAAFSVLIHFLRRLRRTPLCRPALTNHLPFLLTNMINQPRTVSIMYPRDGRFRSVLRRRMQNRFHSLPRLKSITHKGRQQLVGRWRVSSLHQMVPSTRTSINCKLSLQVMDENAISRSKMVMYC